MTVLSCTELFVVCVLYPGRALSPYRPNISNIEVEWYWATDDLVAGGWDGMAVSLSTTSFSIRL